MALHHHLTFALTTLAVTLAGCGAPGLAPQPAQLQGGFEAFAKSLSAKTISTPIGQITLGLHPEPKGLRTEENRLPTFEAELGMPEFDIMRKKGPSSPGKADLRRYFPPARNQGSLGSCSAFAATGMMEAVLNIKGKKAPHLSELFFYYAEREQMEKDGLVPKATKRDTGAFMFVASQAAVRFGSLPEKEVPYRTGKAALAYDATAEQYEAAKEFKFAKRKRVKTVRGIKSALDQKKPVLMGIHLYQSFMTKTVARSGEVPMPMKGEQSVGGHAVVAVGYDDSKEAFIMRNSWGADWGDKGYFYMPYGYYETQTNGQFYYGDCWVLD